MPMLISYKPAMTIFLIIVMTALYGLLSRFHSTPAIEPAKPAPVAMVGDCLESRFPSGFRASRANAERLVADCSNAIQSGILTPSGLALARLNRGTVRMALGDTILASGDYLEALKHYDSAIDPMQPDALALYRRGAVLDGLGQSDRALKDFNQAIRLDPKYPLAFYGRGILLATRERAYARAIADFDKVLQLEPNNVDALTRRGDAYGQLGDFGHAIGDLDRAVQLAPDDVEPYIYRGLVNHRRGKNQLAVADFDTVLKLDPRNVFALRDRGGLYAVNGQPDLAIRDLDAAIALQANDPLSFYNRGYAYFTKRDYKMAILDYGTAIELDPNMGLAYTNRCLTRTIVGQDLVAALEDCDKALKLKPYNLDVRETRGFIYLKLGDPAIAIVEYNAALEVDPNRALALYGRGLARIRMGRVTDGRADQAAARVLDPAVEQQFSLYGVAD
jgi:tetratricopeptide (TPR) repeat protein